MKLARSGAGQRSTGLTTAVCAGLKLVRSCTASVGCAGRRAIDASEADASQHRQSWIAGEARVDFRQAAAPISGSASGFDAVTVSASVAQSRPASRVHRLRRMFHVSFTEL